VLPLVRICVVKNQLRDANIDAFFLPPERYQHESSTLDKHADLPMRKTLLLASSLRVPKLRNSVEMNMKPVHWLMELVITDQQASEFNTLMNEVVAEADREPGTMACELNFNDDGDVCTIYLRFVDADAAIIHLAMFSDKFINRFWQTCTVSGTTILGFANEEVLHALQGFRPVVLSQRAGFARFAE